MSRDKIFAEINAERQYQEDKWGNDNDDKLNTPFHWVTWVTQELTRFTNGTWNPPVANFRKAMVKTAAVAVAAIESVDRKSA